MPRLVMTHFLLAIALVLFWTLVEDTEAGSRTILRDGIAARPVYLILFVPIDADLPAEEASVLAQQWGTDINVWFQREIGAQVVIDYHLVYSSRTRYQLSGGNVDACGDGAMESIVRNEVHTAIGLPETVIESNRLWIVMLGGGGWAGGAYFKLQGNETYGFSLVGDWGLRYALTGQFSPCDPWRDASNPNRAFGHEALHAMGVDSHNPVVYLGDTLSEIQRRSLLRSNKAFLSTP